MKSSGNAETSEAVRASGRGVRRAIDGGIHAHIEGRDAKLGSTYKDHDMRCASGL